MTQSQKDYYSFFAFFNGLEERGQVNYFDQSPVPSMLVEDEELEKKIDFIHRQITVLEEAEHDLKNSEVSSFQNWKKGDFKIKEELDQLQSTGLISHHSLEEIDGLNVEDNASPGHLARMNTGLQNELMPAKVVKGYARNALQFDGHNFLNIGDIGDFEWHDPFSLGAWIRPPGNLIKNVGVLVRRNGEQKRGGYELALTKQGRLRLSLIHDHQNEGIIVESDLRVSGLQWAHVFCTYDGSGKGTGIKLYINGRLQHTRVIKDALNHATILTGNDLLAGNWTHRNRSRDDIGGFDGGRIDEIRVYNRELAGLEVAHLVRPHPDRPIAAIEQDMLYEYYLSQHSTEYISTQITLRQSRRDVQAIPHVMIMKDMDTLRETFVLNRGAYDAPTDQVAPGAPPAVLKYSEEYPHNRLGLAQWITHPDNPLTARVMVNRLWQMMFGNGIVATSDDFGNQGALPSHPELLDWLALDFINSGWDVKSMIKKIALSATYRQSSEVTPNKLKKDPNNLLLSRGPNQRMSAEMIRDNALTISGLLFDSIGGRWVKPYQPPGIWKELANQIGENKYRQGIGKELYRRSLYSYWKRTIPPPTMLTFDASERAVCIVKRQSTSTPLQSLVLLNDPQYIEASRALATQMIAQSDGEVDDGLVFGFRAVTSRYPSEEELELIRILLKKEIQSFDTDHSRAALLVQIGQLPPDPTIDTATLAAWTQVANTLLNLDEAKMKS